MGLCESKECPGGEVATEKMVIEDVAPGALAQLRQEFMSEFAAIPDGSDTGSAEVWKQLGLTLLKDQDPSRAILCFKEAVSFREIHGSLDTPEGVAVLKHLIDAVAEND